MSCICNSPVRPEFKDSYKDLLDKPKINGVTLNGNLTAADLGIKAGAQFKIVTALPITDIDEATVYLVPAQVGQDDNIYQEWIYINGKWEKIGEPINIQPSTESAKVLNANVDISEFVSDTTNNYVLSNSFNWPSGTILSDGLYISSTHVYPSLGEEGLHIRFNISTSYNLYTDDSFGLRGDTSRNVEATFWGQFYGLIYVANGHVTMKGEWTWG